MAIRFQTMCQICLPIFILTILASAETNNTSNTTLRQSNDVPSNTDILRIRQISPKFVNKEENASDRRISLNSVSEINDTNKSTLESLVDVPIDSDRLATRQNSPTFFNTERKAFNRRLSPGVTLTKNEDLQKRLLDLDMWFPCGIIDRCRVGRNYCNVDTNRCEICNSDVCHGTNADSMCNFMCKEIPSPEESSTASSVTASSPVAITTDGCPSVSPSELKAEDSGWKKTAIVFIVVSGLMLIGLASFFIWEYSRRRKTAAITTDGGDVTEHNTSVMEPDIPVIRSNITERGNPVMTLQSSINKDELAVSNGPGP